MKEKRYIKIQSNGLFEINRKGNSIILIYKDKQSRFNADRELWDRILKTIKDIKIF